MSVTISDVQRKAIKGLVQEVSDAMVRQEAERDFIKDAVANIAEKYELEKKVLNRICRTYHRQKYSEDKQDNEEFFDAYEQVFETDSETDSEED